MLLPVTMPFPSTPTNKLPITGISLFDDTTSSSSSCETPDIISHQPSLLILYTVSSYCNDNNQIISLTIWKPGGNQASYGKVTISASQGSRRHMSF